ncbi:papain-like cysteine protease family protein [Saccharothrix australiensis]|uniref:Papain like cysteine protease AvrRpt2 n=1 Tax=Saccharothrix australiensis TaxID=2072 RepID=A0A495W3E0_9PSEU|nr:papain-like cysteine protease family protein [Saccharothrix australiensis]RKT55275.1 papain like cysteine protease AvrRpt2 [Saccharothrix australiensis]
MDRTSIRRGLPCLAPVVLALTAVLSPVSATAATDDRVAPPNGLIRTQEHTEVREVVPTRAPLDVTPRASKKLNYTQQVQQQDQWCWAATGASIERTLGVTVSQQAFCAAGKGGVPGYCPNEGAEIPEIVDAFHGTGFKAEDANGPISFTSITQQIDAGIPHLTGIYWTSGGGHAEVIYGYDSTNQTLMVGDPWPAYQRYQTWNYTQYRRNARFTWGDTIVNIAKAS